MQTDGVIVEHVPVNRFFRRTVTFWFGMYVWTSIMEKYSVEYDQMKDIDEDEFAIDMMYFAQEYGAYHKNKPRQKLSRETIAKSYKLMPQSQLKRIVDCMLKSRMGGDSIIGQLQNAGKKKQDQTN